MAYRLIQLGKLAGSDEGHVGSVGGVPAGHFAVSLKFDEVSEAGFDNHSLFLTLVQ